MRCTALAFTLATLLAIVSCSSSADEAIPPPPNALVDSGSWYSRAQWPHDGAPFESANFLVYSDRASADARQEVANVAEDLWTDLLDEFDVEQGALRYPAGQDAIHIYAYREYFPQEWGMRAYHGGLIMWSPDHPHRPTDIDDYGPVVKHELVHVLESLLRGRDGGVEPMADTWFSEGLAEAVAGGTAGGAIRDLSRLDQLTAEYGETSPVWFKRDAQATPGAGYDFNYPMYQLAVEYLLDDQGVGRSLGDAREVFVAMGSGDDFETAFNAHMGVDLGEYERTFFARMEAFLPQHANPVFSPGGLAIVAMLAVTLMSGTLVTAHRRWATATGPDARQVPRGSQIGFTVSTGLAAAIAVTFFLGILFIAGTELTNAMDAADQRTTFWILAAYLVVTTALLVWSVREWAARSRTAWLGAPLVLAVTVATFTAIAAVV